jgi:hypothetical protein
MATALMTSESGLATNRNRTDTVAYDVGDRRSVRTRPRIRGRRGRTERGPREAKPARRFSAPRVPRPRLEPPVDSSQTTAAFQASSIARRVQTRSELVPHIKRHVGVRAFTTGSPSEACDRENHGHRPDLHTHLDLVLRKLQPERRTLTEGACSGASCFGLRLRTRPSSLPHLCIAESTALALGRCVSGEKATGIG